MKFKSIYLKEGMLTRKIDFISSSNLIFSESNSKGKTTLLRFMLYGLGYNIPSTKNIRFNNCEVELTIDCEYLGTVTLKRYSQDALHLDENGKIVTFVLPEQMYDLHSKIFNTENKNILSNLLGAFYVDQEKGWTLLNRGVVIGSNRFNIEELIRGLSNIDCSTLLLKEKNINKKLNKYKQMFSVSEYQQTIQKLENSLIIDDFNEKANYKLDSLIAQKNQVQSELKRVDRILSGNKTFKKYISEMKIIVQLPSGDNIQVTEDNILGLNDSIEILIAKRKLISSKLVKILSDIEDLNVQIQKENEQQGFIKTLKNIDVFDEHISRIPFNQVAIKKEIKDLEDSLKEVRSLISKTTRSDNSTIKDMSQKIYNYAAELGLGDIDSFPETYLFTSNLKELSGAVLHKTAFAFRLGYVIAIEKVIGIKLPIILDSPSGKEVDRENIELMMNILKRDFNDHQIIIASIYDYNFENENTIKIKERLIEDISV